MLTLDTLRKKTSQLRTLLAEHSVTISDDARIDDFFYYLLHSKDAVFVVPYLLMRFFDVSLSQGIAVARQFETDVIDGLEPALFEANRGLGLTQMDQDERLQQIEKKYPDKTEELQITNYKLRSDKPQSTLSVSEESLVVPVERGMGESKDTSDKSIANFYFSAEDEAEITEMAQRVTELAAVRHTDIYIEFAAKAAIQSLTVISLAGAMRSRLDSIIISRLRDLRDLLETQEALMKPIDRGGLELSRADADRVLKEIEKVRSAVSESMRAIQGQQRTLVRHTSSPATLPTPPTFGVSQKQPVPISPVPTNKNDAPGARQQVPSASAPSIPSLNSNQRVLPVAAQEISNQVKQEISGGGALGSGLKNVGTGFLSRLKGSFVSPTAVVPLAVSVPTAMDSLAAMQKSAKEQKRLIGPLEEIETLTLEEFRKWGPAEGATQRLKEKIDLLTRESLVKKKQGIEAWKRSVVHKQYLALGAASMDQKKSVEDIAADWQKAGKTTLTKAEFDAVADLNRKLQFN